MERWEISYVSKCFIERFHSVIFLRMFSLPIDEAEVIEIRKDEKSGAIEYYIHYEECMCMDVGGLLNFFNKVLNCFNWRVRF